MTGPEDAEVLIKYEGMNIGDSIKTRTALRMIEATEREGRPSKDRVIAEPTSGNPDIRMVLERAVKNCKVVIIMPDPISEECGPLARQHGAFSSADALRMPADRLSRRRTGGFPMKKQQWIALILLGGALISGCSFRPSGRPAAASTQASTPAPTQAPTAEPTAVPTQVPAEPEPTAEPAAELPGEPSELPEAFPLLMEFSSGAGGWGTEMTLERDGAFSGRYHDSEMGETGEEYPNGSVYIATFNGRFTDIRRLPDGTYTMKLGEVTTMDAPGDEWIQDGVRFIASDAYGLDTWETGDFVLYPPETEVSALDEEFYSWWPGRFNLDSVPFTLGCWGLRNMDSGFGFFSYG